MFYRHFHQHQLVVDDTFYIWSFSKEVKKHKIKTVSDDHNVECYCKEEETIICTDLNYINCAWEKAPVLSHGECTAAPPSWRQIEIGKYVRMQHLLQVATYAVMVGGAVLLHRAGTAAQTSMSGKPEQTASRPMSIQEMSQLASLDTSIIVPPEASVVQIEGESIGSLNVSIDSQTFREVSSCSHSLSGLSDKVGSSFANSVLIAPEAEAEVVANLDNTFSDSMFKPKTIQIDNQKLAQSINLEGYQGEFADPFTKKFVANVDAGKTFFENVLKNEILSADTKELIHGLLLDIDVNAVVNKQVSKQAIAALEKEIGGFKVFTNFTGSAKPSAPVPPPVTYDIQYYKALVGTSKIGSVTQTSVDKGWRTAITEVKREFLLQTSLDVDLIKVASIQHLDSEVAVPSFRYKRTNAPFIGHSSLLFDVCNDSMADLPAIPLVLMVGCESYLVSGLFDGALWVYCNRDKLEEADKHCKETPENHIILVPQVRRKFAFWMHVDAKVINDKTLNVHDDVADVIRSSGRIWLLNGTQRDRRGVLRGEGSFELKEKQLLLNGCSWPHEEKTFLSPFQFNGVEMINLKMPCGNLFALPPICTLLPYNHLQLCAYDKDFKICEARTITLDYKKSNAFGFVCGNDYLEVTQKDINAVLREWVTQPYRTISFFSTYDFSPCYIKSIIFKRPWVLFPTFWYMHIELHNNHGITWSQWSKHEEDKYMANPTFTMDILGDAAEKHLHVRHRCRLRISAITDARTLVFTTTENGDEKNIHPSVLQTSTLGFPLDENMSTLEMKKRKIEEARKPMVC